MNLMTGARQRQSATGGALKGFSFKQAKIDDTYQVVVQREKI